ncbi:MAG TPA: DNA-directed RNA polymerase subunit alpha C-terminal domain-containing protein [Thermomicrobiales bacterium]
MKSVGHSPSRSRPASEAWRGYQTATSTGQLADPFAVNPIRRSTALVVACSLTVTAPWAFGEGVGTTVMLSVGWLAMTGLVIGIPVLLISLLEAGFTLARRRLRPSVEQLDISPRVQHVLMRHGYHAIADVDRTPDAALLLLSNMDARALREVRRAIALWKYRRWQERGFPVSGEDAP